jgi:hypothetical protein
MGRIGKITAPPEVGRAKNGESDVLMLTVRFSDGGTASAQWMPGAGDDTSPQEGDTVAADRYGGVLIVTASKSPGAPALKTGEREIYSRDPGGSPAARCIFKTDGGVILESIKAESKILLSPEGEIVYSNKAGAKTSLNKAGKQYIANNITSLCTVLLGIIDQIENLVTAGAPTLHTVHPDSKKVLELYKQVIESLLAKEG